MNQLQIKKTLKETWNKLMGSDESVFINRRERFSDKLEELYGIAKEESEQKTHMLEEACYNPRDGIDRKSNNKANAVDE